MSAQGGAVTSGYGSASLRLSADETQAIFRYSYANLTSPVVGEAHPLRRPWRAQIIFDIDTATPNPDGSYTWNHRRLSARFSRPTSST